MYIEQSLQFVVFKMNERTVIFHSSKSVTPTLKPPEPKVMVDPIPTAADGKPRLGRFGELLDADGNQILGKALKNYK